MFYFYVCLNNYLQLASQVFKATMQPQYVPEQQGVIVVTQNDPAANDNKLSPSALKQMRV